MSIGGNAGFDSATHNSRDMPQDGLLVWDEPKLLAVGREIVASSCANRHSEYIKLARKLSEDGMQQSGAENAALVLGWIGTDEAIEILEEMLECEPSRPRAKAVFVLTQIVPDSRCARLCEALNDLDLDVARVASDALGWRGGDYLVPHVEATVKRSSTQAKRCALNTLRLIGSKKALHAAERLRRDLERSP